MAGRGILLRSPDQRARLTGWPLAARSLMVVVLALFLIQPPCSARGADQTIDRAELEVWIEKLNSPIRAERLEAAETLHTQGTSILPLLRDAAIVSDSGDQFVLQQFQRRVEREAVDAALKGTRITLKAATLREAANAISSQCVTPVTLSLDYPDITFNPPLEFQDVSFWYVLQKLCHASGTDWGWEKETQGDSEREGIRLLAGADPKVKVYSAVTGCFRIAAVPVEREGASTLRWRFRIEAEGAVRPLCAIVRDSEIQISKDGNRFTPFTPDARREILFSGQSAEFHVDVLPGDASRNQPEQIRGTIQIRCEILPQDLRFPIGTGRPQVHFAGDTEIRLLSTHRKKDLLEATFAVTFPPGVNWQSHQLDHLHQEAWLLRGTNGPIHFRSRKLLSETMPTHIVQYEFPLTDENEGSELLYRFPSADRIIDVTFDIPLPTSIAK